jgi:hypothetical protein
MPDDFGIIGTAIQELEEINDDLFSDVETKKPEKKEAPKEEKKKEEEKLPAPTLEEEQEEFFGKEEDAPEDKKTPETKSSEKPKDEEVNQFETLSKSLYEIGVFEGETNEDGTPVQTVAKTPEEFKELWEDQKAKALDSSLYSYLMNKHGQEGIDVFKAIFQDGINPREYFQTYTEIEDLSALDVENEAHQEQIVKQSLREDGWAEDKILTKIAKLKDRAELQEEAEMRLPKMVESKQQAILNKQQAIQKEAQQKEANEIQYKSSLNKALSEAIKAQELNGISITQEKAQKVFSYMNDKKYENKSTGQKYTQYEVDMMELKKPDNIKTNITNAILMMDKHDFSSIQKKAISKETNTLFKEFAQRKSKASTPAFAEEKWKL